MRRNLEDASQGEAWSGVTHEAVFPRPSGPSPASRGDVRRSAPLALSLKPRSRDRQTRIDIMSDQEQTTVSREAEEALPAASIDAANGHDADMLRPGVEYEGDLEIEPVGPDDFEALPWDEVLILRLVFVYGASEVVDGTNFEAHADNPFAFSMPYTISTTHRRTITVFGETSNFKVHLRNDSGASVTATVRYRQAVQ